VRFTPLIFLLTAGMAAAQEPTKKPVRRQVVTPELERTAFRDPQARTLLARAREARLAQDAALSAYDAKTYMRISVGLGVRRLGVEKLFFRTEQAARVRWARATGLWVEPTGRRAVFPMGHAEIDLTEATPIPFFPGRESLWFPGSDITEVEVDENELLHPLAEGAEAYYKFETGDSATIRLPEGRVIALRELRITARRPEWRAFVGSFWFDVERGSLVRAAYRSAAEMDIWRIAKEEARREIEELEAKIRTDTGKALDSARRELKEAQAEVSESRVAGSILTPMRANISAITVEYGLHQGRFWLPRLNVAEGEIVATIMRVPIRFEESFSYSSVIADTGAAPLARAAGAATDTNSAAFLAMRDSGYFSSGNLNIGVDSRRGTRPPPDQDSLYRYRVHRADSLRKVADSVHATGDTVAARELRLRAGRNVQIANQIKRRKEACARGDSSYFAGSSSRYDGQLRIAIRMPCDTSRFATSPDLPPSIYVEGEQVFGESERDALIGALDMDLQPGWLPQPPELHTGLDMLRYNKVEGLSVGATLTSELGRGYSARAEARLGTADLVPNGELSAARSNGRDELRLTAFHRLSVANDDFGQPLSFGASLGNLIDAGDEGFYYRSWGAELAGTRRAPLFGVPVEWRLFAEGQRSAGAEPNTQASLGNLIGNSRFRPNIDATRLAALGLRLETARSFGVNPARPRLDTRLRLEGAATDRSDMTSVTGYGRYVFNATLSSPLGPVSGALTGAAGMSSGDLPIQRAFFVGGLHTVRGQIATLDEGRVGNAFWLSRTELGLTRSLALKPTVFYDVGWAGSRNDVTNVGRPLSGAGIGLSFLDGLLRIDVARGIWPEKRWRTDFYLGSVF
jgi:hypothetical protein